MATKIKLENPQTGESITGFYGFPGLHSCLVLFQLCSGKTL
ncbi:hypothetical protein ABUU27_24145 [Escherichia coli]